MGFSYGLAVFFGLFCIVLGGVVAFAGLFYFPNSFIPAIVEEEFLKNVMFTEEDNTLQNSRWASFTGGPEEPDIESEFGDEDGAYMLYFLTNVTNPKEIYFGAKPRIHEVGPFGISYIQRRFDIVFRQEDVLEYKTYHFTKYLSPDACEEIMISIDHPKPSKCLDMKTNVTVLSAGAPRALDGNDEYQVIGRLAAIILDNAKFPIFELLAELKEFILATVNTRVYEAGHIHSILLTLKATYDSNLSRLGNNKLNFHISLNNATANFFESPAKTITDTLSAAGETGQTMGFSNQTFIDRLYDNSGNISLVSTQGFYLWHQALENVETRARLVADCESFGMDFCSIRIAGVLQFLFDKNTGIYGSRTRKDKFYELYNTQATALNCDYAGTKCTLGIANEKTKHGLSSYNSIISRRLAEIDPINEANNHLHFFSPRNVKRMIGTANYCDGSDEQRQHTCPYFTENRRHFNDVRFWVLTYLGLDPSQSRFQVMGGNYTCTIAEHFYKNHYASSSAPWWNSQIAKTFYDEYPLVRERVDASLGSSARFQQDFSSGLEHIYALEMSHGILSAMRDAAKPGVPLLYPEVPDHQIIKLDNGGEYNVSMDRWVEILDFLSASQKRSPEASEDDLVYPNMIEFLKEATLVKNTGNPFLRQGVTFNISATYDNPQIPVELRETFRTRNPSNNATVGTTLVKLVNSKLYSYLWEKQYEICANRDSSVHEYGGCDYKGGMLFRETTAEKFLFLGYTDNIFRFFSRGTIEALTDDTYALECQNKYFLLNNGAWSNETEPPEGTEWQLDTYSCSWRYRDQRCHDEVVVIEDRQNSSNRFVWDMDKNPEHFYGIQNNYYLHNVTGRNTTSGNMEPGKSYSLGMPHTEAVNFGTHLRNLTFHKKRSCPGDGIWCTSVINNGALNISKMQQVIESYGSSVASLDNATAFFGTYGYQYPPKFYAGIQELLCDEYLEVQDSEVGGYRIYLEKETEIDFSDQGVQDTIPVCRYRRTQRTLIDALNQLQNMPDSFFPPVGFWPFSAPSNSSYQFYSSAPNFYWDKQFNGGKEMAKFDLIDPPDSLGDDPYVDVETGTGSVYRGVNRIGTYVKIEKSIFYPLLAEDYYMFPRYSTASLTMISREYADSTADFLGLYRDAGATSMAIGAAAGIVFVLAGICLVVRARTHQGGDESEDFSS